MFWPCRKSFNSVTPNTDILLFGVIGNTRRSGRRIGSSNLSGATKNEPFIFETIYCKIIVRING